MFFRKSYLVWLATFYMNRQVVSLVSKMPSKLAIIANRVKF